MSLKTKLCFKSFLLKILNSTIPNFMLEMENEDVSMYFDFITSIRKKNLLLLFFLIPSHPSPPRCPPGNLHRPKHLSAWKTQVGIVFKFWFR